VGWTPPDTPETEAPVARVMIVDDDAPTRRMLLRHLQRAGWAVIEAGGGDEALGLLEREDPDVVLLDMTMPGRSGVEVCRELRANPVHARTYVMLLTAAHGSEQKVEGLDAGADDYLTKPFEVEELLARIRVGVRTTARNREALEDRLTRLYTRSFLEEAAAYHLRQADAGGHAVCLLLADLDRLKEINDRQGHPAGDRALAAVADVMRGCCRESDLTARWGGDEFAVLLPRAEMEQAVEVAERIRETLGKRTPDALGTLTASLGLAQRRPDEPFEALLGRADKALYRAKQEGRNRVVSDR